MGLWDYRKGVVGALGAVCLVALGVINVAAAPVAGVSASAAPVAVASVAAASAAAAPVVAASAAGTAAAAGAVATETETAPVIVVKAYITACEVDPYKQSIQMEGSYEGEMAGTDGNFYLFELRPYEAEIGSRTDYFEKIAHGGRLYGKLPLEWSTAVDRPYNRYVVAVWDTEKQTYMAVSDPHYITNPEILAPDQKEFPNTQTKKGLRIQIDMLADAMELGVKHAGTDILFQQILGTGIDYEYGGKTYHFSKAVMEEYDRTISSMSAKGISITAVILNGWSDAAPQLHHPGTEKNSAAYHYMFNVATLEGYEQTRAIAAFLAERYNGSDPDHGRIVNWVIGNEVNNQKQWNYLGAMDLAGYVEEYQKAVRVFYTAIKTATASDRVYISLDFHWNNPAEIDNQLKYAGKDVIDTFNDLTRRQGQFDWGLAYHPYPYPMIEPEFWDDAQTGLVTEGFDSPVINFANLHVLTDYLAQEPFRGPDGQVRHVILTEQGFSAKSNTRGDVPYIQAAAFAYSYYLVDSNPYIDAYLLSRQVDAPSEAAQGIAFGLWSCDMNRPNHIVPWQRRKIWQVFKHIDNPNSTLENSAFAKEIIGIGKWSDVIPDFKWRRQEN